MPKDNSFLLDDNILSNEDKIRLELNLKHDIEFPYIEYIPPPKKIQEIGKVKNLKPVVKKFDIELKKKQEIKIDNNKFISNEEINQLGMDWKFIDKVGIELEGAWLNFRDDLHPDLSFSKEDFDYKYESVGEFTSKPMNNSIQVFKCIRDNYPDYAKPIRNSCAFHVHFSLKNPALYAVCMNKDFYDKFLEKIIEWGKKYPCKNEEFWHRVEGRNRYCRKEFHPDFQASFCEKGHNRESRRTQLNYCYGHLRTIECRLFPVFESCKTAIYATKALLSFVEDYLTKNQLKELEFEDKVVDIVEQNKDNYQKINLEIESRKTKKSKNIFNLFQVSSTESNIKRDILF